MCRFWPTHAVHTGIIAEICAARFHWGWMSNSNSNVFRVGLRENLSCLATLETFNYSLRVSFLRVPFPFFYGAARRLMRRQRRLLFLASASFKFFAMCGVICLLGGGSGKVRNTMLQRSNVFFFNHHAELTAVPHPIRIGPASGKARYL